MAWFNRDRDALFEEMQEQIKQAESKEVNVDTYKNVLQIISDQRNLTRHAEVTYDENVDS